MAGKSAMSARKIWHIRMRLLSVPARASSRSTAASTCAVWPAMSALPSAATCPARKHMPLCTAISDMRAPMSNR
jgi:hypothetical protein